MHPASESRFVLCNPLATGLVVLCFAAIALLVPAGLHTAEAKGPKASQSRVQIRVSGLNIPASQSRAKVTVKQIGRKAKGQRKLVRKSLQPKGNATENLILPLGKYRVTANSFQSDAGRFTPRVTPRILKTTAKKKKAVVRVAYRGSGGAISGIKFNLRGAIGLLTVGSGARSARQGASRAASGSNLKALLPSGELRDAIEFGGPQYGQQPQVKQFVLAPDGDVYIVFQFPIYTGVGNGCVLMKVDRDTDEAECVDPDLQQVNTWAWNWGSEQDPVQFDSAGSVYYLGYKWSQGGGMPETILRRKAADGTFEDFIKFPNAQVSDFKVSPAGAVLHSGFTYSSGGPGSSFLRVVTPSRRLKNLTMPGPQSGSGYAPQVMKRFPNGQIYASQMVQDTCESESGSQWTCFKPAISTYSDNSESFDELWLGSNSWDPTPQHSFEGFCARKGSSAPSDFPQFCGTDTNNSWSGFQPSFVASGERVFQLSSVFSGGPQPSSVSLVKIYPDFDAFRIRSLDSVTTAGPAGNRVVLAGKRADEFLLIALDPDTGEETPLIPARSEIEVFNVQYSPTENKIYFHGLRYENNSYVFGSVGPDGESLTFEEAARDKWQQFQLFG